MQFFQQELNDTTSHWHLKKMEKNVEVLNSRPFIMGGLVVKQVN